MTQYDGSPAAGSSWPGATAHADFFGLLAHVLSQGAGASRPTQLAAGGLWAKALGGGGYEVYLYDGSVDYRIGGTQPANGNFSSLSIDGQPVASVVQEKFFSEDATYSVTSTSYQVTGPTNTVTPVRADTEFEISYVAGIDIDQTGTDDDHLGGFFIAVRNSSGAYTSRGGKAGELTNGIFNGNGPGGHRAVVSLTDRITLSERASLLYDGELTLRHQLRVSDDGTPGYAVRIRSYWTRVSVKEIIPA